MNTIRKTTALFVFVATLGSAATIDAKAQTRGEVLNVSVKEVKQNCSPTDPLCVPGGDLPDPNPPGGPIGGGDLLPLPGGGTGCDPLDPWCNPYPYPGNPGKIDFGTLFALGNKVWDFIITNKPNAEYKTLRASVLPGGVESWSQLKGWKKPVSKVYRVEFKNLRGKSAGGFDYRITFIYGGGHEGKGKYIGQIAFAPANVQLKTDRQLNVKAELLEPLNFGTEEDPIAGVQLLITWHSNTTFRYNMNSIEYFLYGTGEVEDISNGTGIYTY